MARPATSSRTSEALAGSALAARPWGSRCRSWLTLGPAPVAELAVGELDAVLTGDTDPGGGHAPGAGGITDQPECHVGPATGGAGHPVGGAAGGGHRPTFGAASQSENCWIARRVGPNRRSGECHSGVVTTHSTRTHRGRSRMSSGIQVMVARLRRHHGRR